MNNLQLDSKVNAFLESKVMPVIMAICNGKCELVKIQQRFNENSVAIKNRYKDHFLDYLGLGIQYNSDSQERSKKANREILVPFSCGFKDRNEVCNWVGRGNPTVFLNAPDLMVAYQRICNSSKKKPSFIDAVFQSVIIIGFMHEIDHLATGLTDTGYSEVSGYDTEKVVQIESIVHGLTCKFVTSVLVEVYKKPLSDYDKFYYQHWVKCGRNSSNPQWKSFITGIYRMLN